MHPGQPSMMPVFSFLPKSFSLFYCLCCIVKMLHLLHLIDGLCNSCRRSRINDYIIDISVPAEVAPILRRKRKFTIGAVGRLVPVKGFGRLVDVARRFLDSGYDFDFWIIGEGVEHEALSRKISKLGLSENVFLLGYHPCPAKVIAMCDVFVSTSVSEGLSLVICEAMTQNLPIVSTNTSGANELLDGGKFGILTGHDTESIFNGIRRLADDVSLRNRFSELSGERVKIFDTQRLLSVFDQIVEGRHENSSCN